MAGANNPDRYRDIAPSGMVLVTPTRTVTVGSIQQASDQVVLSRQTTYAPAGQPGHVPAHTQVPARSRGRGDADDGAVITPAPVFVSAGRRTAVLRWTMRIAGLAVAVWAALAGVALLGADEPADLRVPRSRALPIEPVDDAADPEGADLEGVDPIDVVPRGDDPVEIDPPGPNGRELGGGRPATQGEPGADAEATDPVVSLPIIVPPGEEPAADERTGADATPGGT